MDDLLLAIPDFLEEHANGQFPHILDTGEFQFPVHDIEEEGQRYLVFQVGLPEWVLAEIEHGTFGHMVGFRIKIDNMPDNVIPFPLHRVARDPAD